MIYAYLRQAPQSLLLSQQQKFILSFALTQLIQIDKEVIEYSAKHRPVEERGEFESFVHGLKENDSIVVATLSSLSNFADEAVKIITCFLSRGVTLFVASSGVCINQSTPIGDILPLLNDLREAQKAQSKHIGRPKGSKSYSKFDASYVKILDLLKNGQSVSAIARELQVSRTSLKDYIDSRGIKEILDSSFVSIDKTQTSEHTHDKLIICPFKNTNHITKG
ncbi:MAG: recombinase family protein [Sulfurovaceae bacterium]|nr:recombinase family protein [Sulfurovaceae bacterium]